MTGRSLRKGGAWRVAVALALAASVVVVVPSSVSAAPEGGTLTSDPAVTAIVKEQVLLSGTLPAGRPRPITLQRRPGTGSWTTAATGTTAADGAFSFTVTMPASVNSSVNYRVLAPWNTAGTPTLPAVQTPVVNLRTVGQSALLTAPDTVPVGSSYELVGTFGPARPGRPVVFQRRTAAGGWTQVAQRTQGGDGTASASLPATAQGQVVYRVLSKKWRGAPQVVSASRTVTVGALTDTTPPPVPGGLAATAGDRAVDLVWDAAAAPDLAGYRVYQGPSQDGPWTRIAEPTGLEHRAVGLTNATAYWFSVSSVDARGNESARSAPVSATPVDRTPPPAVTLLSATPGDGAVTLTWAALDDDVTYRVFRAGAEDGPFTPVADDLTATEHTVEGLDNGLAHWFRVTAVDAGGNESPPSAALAAVPQDTTAPAAPTGLDGAPGDRSATLTWDAVTAGDLAGYRVYQGPSAEGPWQQVTGPPFAQREYAATGLTNGSTLWWAVTSIDHSGNESDFGAPVAVTPADTTPPGVPQSPWLIQGDRKVILSWGGEYGPDFLGNYVYLASSPDGPWARVSETPGTAPYEVSGLTNGTTYWFSVTAADVDGNESARSEVISGTPYDNVQPPTPAGLAATRTDDGVVLTWEAVDDAGLVGYHVFRSTSADPDASRSQLNWEPTTGTTLVDDTAVEGTSYWYEVASRDAAGNYSPLSAKVRLDLVDTSAPPTPTGLVAVAGTGQVDLAWEPVSAPDLAGYRVYRADGADGPWSQVGGLRTDAAATVTGLPNEVAHHFAVTAVDESGNESDRSDPASATPDGPVAMATRLASGAEHSCRIRSDGTLWCWGANERGQLGDGTTVDRRTPVQVGTASDWITVSAGSQHTCGLREGGSAWCWGSSWYGALGTSVGGNESTTPVQVQGGHAWASITAGYEFSCGATLDGTAWCWGSNGYGQLGQGEASDGTSTPQQVGTSADWVSLSAGIRSVCGVRLDGSLWCWGSNYNGELGMGDRVDRATPERVPDGVWRAVSAGWSHTCGVQVDGSLWCWGWNPSGAVGGGAEILQTTPWRVGSDQDWVAVSAGLGFSCALREDASAWCWGSNRDGRVGDGTEVDQPEPVRLGPGDVSWSQLAAGAMHACGLRTDGGTWCWGDNHRSQMGAEPPVARTAPHRVVGDGDWLNLSAAGSYTCGVRADHTAWCWGTNSSGQFGDVAPYASSVPEQVGTAQDWARLSIGSATACGIRTDGSAWCWGYNSSGQVGDGTSNNLRVPTRVGTATDWTSIEPGDYYHSCGLRDGTAWCWGDNYYGQLGDGTSTRRLTPTQVGSASDWTQISPGTTTTCGIRAGGSLWCWGDNQYGQLGDGTTTARNAPVQIVPAATWVSVDVGSQSTCATRQDGTAWCWGANYRGQLGDGTTTNRSAPVQVGTAAGWVAVAVEQYHSCGVRSDGTLRCWGSNWSGQLGDGTTTDSLQPVPVGDDASWTAAALGSSHSCGLRTDGTAWCWGSDYYGELGDGALLFAPAPVRVPD